MTPIPLKDFLITLRHDTYIVILDDYTAGDQHVQDYFPGLKYPVRWAGKRQDLLYPKDGYIFAEEGFDDYEVLVAGAINGLNNDPHIMIHVLRRNRYPEFKDDPS